MEKWNSPCYLLKTLENFAFLFANNEYTVIMFWLLCDIKTLLITKDVETISDIILFLNSRGTAWRKPAQVRQFVLSTLF